MKVVLIAVNLFIISHLLIACAAQNSHQCTRIRVGEVTPTSAIVWTRLSQNSQRNANGPESAGPHTPLSQLIKSRYDCPGARGTIQLQYSTSSGFSNSVTTSAFSVGPTSDYTKKFYLKNLKPGTVYYYRSITASPSGEKHQPRSGKFRTAPTSSSEAGVSFTVLTCQRHVDLDNKAGFNIYPSMTKLNPNFTISLGDLVYYDNEWPETKTRDLARYHWHRMYSLPRLLEYHSQFPGYFTRDDHDTRENDCAASDGIKAGDFSFQDGADIFQEQMPIVDGAVMYRTFTWGKHLKFWILASRDYRVKNNWGSDGPKKTLLGERQKAWLKQTVSASKSTWNIIVSPNPIVGPDKESKADNLSSKQFKYEGDEIRKFLSSKKNTFVITGDRHWQYHSVDPTTKLNEFSIGPASNEHVNQAPGENLEYHKFYRPLGGFFPVHVAGGGSSVSFHFHSVTGQVVYQYTAKR